MTNNSVYYTTEMKEMPTGHIRDDQDLWGDEAPARAALPARWISLVLVLLLLVGVGLLIPAGLAAVYYSDFIMPGVSVLGRDLGGQTVSEASGTLSREWASRQITLQGGDRNITVSPTTLGITLDANATAYAAGRLGRQGEGITDLLAVYRGGYELVPVWQIDLAVTEANLSSYEHLLSTPAQDAQLQFVNGALVIAPATPGTQLDVAGTVMWLGNNSGQAVISGQAPLLFSETSPTIGADQLEPLRAQAQAWLDQPVTLRLYDPVYDTVQFLDVAPASWGAWVNLTIDQTAAQPLQVTIDNAAMTQFLTTNLAELPARSYVDVTAAATAIDAVLQGRLTAPQTAAIQLRVFHQDQLHTVQSGETLSSIGRDYGVPYPWIQEANPQLGDNLAIGQQITIPSVDNFLPLPVVENKRIVVSISEQKMWAYENGQLVFEWVVSTGIDSSPTAPGIFQIQSFEEEAYAGNWNLWMPSFIGIYRPVPTSEFMNGFHGFPTRNGSNLLWTGDLGHPVTYGCVLVSSTNALTLFDWAELGVVVEVRA